MSDDLKPHRKHEQIVEAIVVRDLTDVAIARELHVDKRAVADRRAWLGLKPKTNSTTPEDKLNRFSSEPDSNGHIRWTGRTDRYGAPRIRQQGVSIPATHVAFERRTGRKPVGICRAECGMRGCIADGHVADDLERRSARALERAVMGLNPIPWDECPAGHSWGEHGRIEPDLTPFCKACATDRARRHRATRIAEEQEG